MLERLAGGARETVADAAEIARARGAAEVLPEHLLLAAARSPLDVVQQALHELAIDRPEIAAALEEDLVATLAVVGVPADVVAATPPRPRADRPRFGPAAAAALRRALSEAARRSERRVGTEHVLLGLLQPADPSVVRVLAQLGVTPGSLADQLRLELASATRP